MSLWTPEGEHPVDGPDADPYESLSDEDRTRLEDAAAEMAEVRRQLASVPAEVVVANHLMGLYELAAIHLSQQPPNFEAGRLAIDALGAVVDALADRLGDAEPTLRDALAQIRLAFVQLQGGSEATAGEDGAE